MTAQKTILTVWEVWTYDVWNSQDGYDVNDRFCQDRHYELTVPVVVYNVGTPNEFENASPTDEQIKELFGARAETDGCGNDLSLYVQNSRTGKPLGEINCVSHDSLSPIREKSQPIGSDDKSLPQT